MKSQTYLALKFLSGKRRSFLFSSLTFMAVLGVVVSVVAFLVVESVMSGFGKDLQAKILGFSSHLTLSLGEGADHVPSLITELQKKNKEVNEIVRFVEGEGVIRTQEGEVQGVRIRGIDEKNPPLLREMKVFFEEGEDWDSLSSREAELPGILLGKELAANLGVIPVLSEKVELLYPFGEVGPTGEVEPNLRAFRVIGVFQSGYYEYDQKYTLVALPEGKILWGEAVQEKLGIFLKRPHQASAKKSSFAAIPGVDTVESWDEQHAKLFSALKLERAGMAVVLVLMMTLASFNILSMLMMVVYERRRDIAVLRSLGMSERSIAGIFYRAGVGIGLVGALVGCILGVGLCTWLASARVRMPSPYYIEALPVDLSWTILLFVFFTAPLLSVLATYFPAREGKKLSLVEALRYE